MADKVSLPSLHSNEREAADGVGGRHLGTRVGHVALREMERGKRGSALQRREYAECGHGRSKDGSVQCPMLRLCVDCTALAS